MNEYAKVVKLLTSYRLKIGMSQDELAKRTGKSQASVSRHMGGGIGTISYEEMIAMGCSVEELDQMFCVGTGIRPVISPVRELVNSVPKNEVFRVQEGIRFGLEKSDLVKGKYANEIKLMQLESLRRDEENYSVIRSLKEVSGRTIEGISDACNMNTRCFERYMKREKMPDAKDLYVLCEVFETRPSIIVSNSAYQVSLLEEMWEYAEDLDRNRMLAYIQKLI